jgi:hypothetical protein
VTIHEAAELQLAQRLLDGPLLEGRPATVLSERVADLANRRRRVRPRYFELARERRDLRPSLGDLEHDGEYGGRAVGPHGHTPSQRRGTGDGRLLLDRER